MKTIKLLNELKKYPVFNTKIIKDIINKKNNYAKLVIHRLKKANLIYEIERNKYSLYSDALIIASNLLWPSYISCWSALRYYNLTEQLPSSIFIITPRARKKSQIMFNNTKIIFIKINKKHFFGYKRENYDNSNIFIAEKEKAIIDSALLKKISFSEIIEIIKNNKKNINFTLLVDYLLKINNLSLIKRFAFLLNNLSIKTERLEKLINSKYISLDYALKKEGIKNKKFRVIENVKL